LFNVFSGTGGVTRNIIEDSPTVGPPAKWTGYDYANTTRVVSSGNLPTNSARDGNTGVTVERIVCGALRSVRTFTYSAGNLSAVT
jgi:hypothetical protein